MKRILVTVMAAILGFAFVPGCASAKGAAELDKKKVNFKSEVGSLTINNETSQDIVIFVGKVEKGTQIGGIKAVSTRSFNLSKIPGIPNSGSLLIRAVAFGDGKKKIKPTEEEVIYTGLVVYNLKDTLEKINVSIYSGVDTERQTCIYISNESENFVLELRKDNPSQGEVIATLPPLATNRRIYLTPRDDGLAYDFYPTFVYVNPKTGEKTSMNAGKTDRKRAIPEPAGGNITPMRFKGPSNGNIGYDVAFISIQNDTHDGLEFRNVETTLKNQKGVAFTPSGRSDVYEIQCSNGESGQTYTGLTLEFDNFTTKTISKYTFLPGYKYEILVTDMDGNYEYDIREVGKKSITEDARIHLFNE